MAPRRRCRHPSTVATGSSRGGRRGAARAVAADPAAADHAGPLGRAVRAPAANWWGAQRARRVAKVSTAQPASRRATATHAWVASSPSRATRTSACSRRTWTSARCSTAAVTRSARSGTMRRTVPELGLAQRGGDQAWLAARGAPFHAATCARTLRVSGARPPCGLAGGKPAIHRDSRRSYGSAGCMVTLHWSLMKQAARVAFGSGMDVANLCDERTPPPWRGG